MNNSTENIARRKSALATTLVVSVLLILFMFITISFQQDKEIKKNEPIEIAMNFGQTDKGKGEIEPAPNTSTHTKNTPTESTTTSTPVRQETPSSPKKINTTLDKSPVSTPQPKPNSKPTKATTSSEKPKAESKPKMDSKGKNALDNLIGGKGKSKSGGQGSSSSAGNVGDPKGNSNTGKGIEQWASYIPANQKHNCEASGSVYMKITVNANGSIKSVQPKKLYDQCLIDKATFLIKKYVKAYAGADGRTGTYKVDLK